MIRMSIRKLDLASVRGEFIIEDDEQKGVVRSARPFKDIWDALKLLITWVRPALKSVYPKDRRGEIDAALLVAIKDLLEVDWLR